MQVWHRARQFRGRGGRRLQGPEAEGALPSVVAQCCRFLAGSIMKCRGLPPAILELAGAKGLSPWGAGQGLLHSSLTCWRAPRLWCRIIWQRLHVASLHGERGHPSDPGSHRLASQGPAALTSAQPPFPAIAETKRVSGILDCAIAIRWACQLALTGLDWKPVLPIPAPLCLQLAWLMHS